MGTTPVLHGCDQVGTTAQRPTNPPNGFAFYDTTLNMPVFYDETNALWRDGLGRDVTNGAFAFSGDGAPTDGTSGTGAGTAAIGAVYTDYTNGKLYINTNTKASPLWTVVGSQTT